MNQIPRDRLYQLLPAIYQLRDAAEGEPLKALLAVIEQEVRAIEEDIGDLYDNWFIETCDEWVIPYIGDLLDVRALYASSFPKNQSQNQLASNTEALLADRPVHPRPYGQQERRAYIANTLAYRRRKGTTPVLEQLARDVTGWRARAIEFSQLLLTAQNLNHLRPVSATVDLRDNTSLDLIGTPFEQQAAYTAEVRRAIQGGRYNIPNIGLFVWRLQSYPIERGTACVVAGPEANPTGRFYTFNLLGYDNVPLFNQAQSATDLTKQAQEINLPVPLRYAALAQELEERRQLRLQGKPLPSPRYFNDSSPVLQIFLNGQLNPIPPEEILICRLALTKEEPQEVSAANQAEEEREQVSLEDYQPWRLPEADSEQNQNDVHVPTKVVAVDPELGRIAFLDRDCYLPERVEISYSYGFSDDLGGGPYPRGATKLDLLKDLLKHTAQKPVAESSETQWINPLFWDVEQRASADENPLDTAIQAWNQTTSAWQGIRNYIHIPLARITVPSVQISSEQVRSTFRPGIVGQGLDVLPGCCPTEILITPGLAIDRQGRRLHVWQIETVDLNRLDLRIAPNQTEQFILVISYRAALQGQSYQFDLVPETAISEDGYPTGTLIPLAKLSIRSENSGYKLVSQPDLGARTLHFDSGVVQGLEVKVCSRTLNAVLTPGTAVDERGNVFINTTPQSLSLEDYQGGTVSLVISLTNQIGQNWQLDYFSPEEIANSDQHLYLASFDIPKVEFQINCLSLLLEGLEVQPDFEPMKVRVTPGKARACDGQEFQVPAPEKPIDLQPYQDQTCSLVLCLGSNLTKGKRGDIKVISPDEAFTDFANYLPLATIVVSSSKYDANGGLEIYPTGRVIEGLEVGATDKGISIAVGTARDTQGREIKLESTYQFDLRAYTAQQLVLFISYQRKQGFPLQPIDPPIRQDWQQLGIVSQEPDPADTGIILIKDSLTYEGDLEITVPQGRKLKIIAADDCRPHICGNVWVRGTASSREPNQGELLIEGLLVEGQLIIQPGNLKRLQLIHSTLVPQQGGLWIQPQEETDPCAFDAEDPFAPIASAITILALIQGLWQSNLKLAQTPERLLSQLTHLVTQQITRLIGEIWHILCPWADQIDSSFDSQNDDWNCLLGASASEQETNPQDNSRLEISLYHCICGPITLTGTIPKLCLEDSLLDKGQPRNHEEETSGLAIWAPDTDTQVFTTTVLGMSTVRSLEASNSLFTEKVIVRLHQTGCIRFSHVPEGSQTPPRYQCQPDKVFQETLDPIPDAITSIAVHTQLGAGTISSNPQNPHQIVGDKTAFSKDLFSNNLKVSLEANQAVITAEGQTRTVLRIDDDNHLIINQPFQPNLAIGTIYQTSHLFASSAGGGVFRSLDNGNNWEKANHGLSNLYVAALLAYNQSGVGKIQTDKKLVNAEVPATTAFTQQFRPKDSITVAGQTGRVNAILNDSVLEVEDNFHDLDNPTIFHIPTVLAGTTGGRIFRSKNAGDDWVSLTLSGATSTITALCRYNWTLSGTVIGEDKQRIQVNVPRSKVKFQIGDTITVEDQTFLITEIVSLPPETTTLKLNAPVNTSQNTITFYINTILAATAGDGIFRGNANGENWILIDKGLTNRDIRVLAVSPQGRVYAGTAGDGVFQLIREESNNHQEDSWIPLNKGLKNYNITVLAIDFNEKIFAGTAGDGVFYWNAEEDSWISINQGLTSLDISSLVVTNTELVAATTDGKIFHSKDGGQNWNEPSLDLKGLNITTLAVSSDLHTLFAGTAAGSILRFVPAVNRWLSVNTGLPNVIEKLLIMEQLQPNFTSIKYGAPGYGQLSRSCANELLTGAEDGAEMGTFNGLKKPQREANLQANLEEYLRFGLEAGIFYMT